MIDSRLTIQSDSGGTNSSSRASRPKPYYQPVQGITPLLNQNRLLSGGRISFSGKTGLLSSLLFEGKLYALYNYWVLIGKDVFDSTWWNIFTNSIQTQADQLLKVDAATMLQDSNKTFSRGRERYFSIEIIVSFKWVLNEVRVQTINNIFQL
jgi:hypothetical protein